MHTKNTPPMAVQVLIENAVKHNEISDRKPLTIHITTDDNGNLSISNDIQPKWTATSGTGIGLANLASDTGSCLNGIYK